MVISRPIQEEDGVRIPEARFLIETVMVREIGGRKEAHQPAGRSSENGSGEGLTSREGGNCTASSEGIHGPEGGMEKGRRSPDWVMGRRKTPRGLERVEKRNLAVRRLGTTARACSCGKGPYEERNRVFPVQKHRNGLRQGGMVCGERGREILRALLPSSEKRLTGILS